ncbi:MAG TPA: hypothetical protein VJ831_04800 [Jatrophihabitantaceae bacterium]|nr:hypothetical protein [Jatrophihabitantaceae bacterium]
MGEPTIAEQLLEAQVQFVLSELSSERLRDVVARDVDDVLRIAATLKISDVVDPVAVKDAGRRLVGDIGGSPVVANMAAALSDGIYDMSAGEHHLLGDVLDRDAVLALVQHALTLHTLTDRALDRLTESPIVATIASRFVTKIVGDFLQQNRARAEKVPGMSTVLNLGSGAVSKVRGATDRHLDQLLGDAAGKGATYALKRTNNAIRELIRDAPLEAAAMELWDLHANEPIGDLREYLSKDELREFVLRVHAIVVAARNTEFTGELVDTCIDVFFAQYGDYDVARILSELGITRDHLVEDITTFAEPVIDAVRVDGVLEEFIRARLAPFFRSEKVAAILS